VVRVTDGGAGPAAATIKRRLAAVWSLYGYLVTRADTGVWASPVPRGLQPDCSNGRTPWTACTSATGRPPRDPGSLGGGYNAARAVCSDLGLERWWPDPASVEHAREVGLLPEVRVA
jgi:hypothetical protein